MCRKLFVFVLVLGLAGNASAALVGHWALDGDGTDSSDYGNHGTINGEVAPAVDRFGNPSGAMSFAGGGGDNINVGDAPELNMTGAMTITAWVYLDSTSPVHGGRNGRILGKMGAGGRRAWSTGIEKNVSGVPLPGTIQVSSNGSDVIGLHDNSSLPLDEWVHYAGVYTPGTSLEVYLNGELSSISTNGIPASQYSTNGQSVLIGNRPEAGDCGWYGSLDDVRIYDEALTAAGITQVMIGVPAGAASNPSPANEAPDVSRDVVLKWTPGEFAPAVNGHTVYLSKNFDDVNDGIGGIIQSASSYTPAQRLDFETIYYWRIDEVNGPPDYAVHQGDIWQFKTEPVGYPIADVTATASSSAAGQGAENTINGSGMDAHDLHSKESASMWLSDDVGEQQTWIEYTFDRPYKLHEMWVWNYNIEYENIIGYGLNDVTIEYSTDGSSWTQLEGVHQFEKALGADGYAHNTTIDFAGALAKSVKLTANSNHGPYDKYGLSEVRFFYVPGWAREPDPQDGATGIHPDVILNWRPGREAATHDVYLSTDEQDVINGTVPDTSVADASYDAGTIELGETYHWRVGEVNDAETPTIWQGDIWSFSIQEYLVVDNFESYNGLDSSDPQSNRVFMVWKDGIGYGTQDNPPYSAGNGTGSIIGHDVPPFVELEIIHDGKQSMPYFYNNSGLSGKANYSEAAVDISDLGIGPDWTRAGIKTLTLYFYGDSANSAGEQMYVKINGVEVPYGGASSDITHGIWQPWDIDLSSIVGVDLQNVTELIIGFRNGGGSGVVYFDNIRLNPTIEIPDSQAPDDSALVAHWDFEGDFDDATGKGHDGLAFGNPIIINDPLRGQVLEVDGDDRIGVSDAADLNFGANESLTLTIWANLDLVDAPEGWKAIVAKGRTELGGGTEYVDELYGFYVSPDNNWHVNAGGIGGDAQAAAGGQWHHLAFVQDGPAGEGYFYVDGELFISGGADSCDTTGRPLFIGAGGTDVAVSAFESFKGRIDDVRIYSYALSQLEIQYLALD